ncbi:FAD binding domain-containing protein [Celeribacter litoreus]|uniref:FAD binding domain-containing protein n=1 Tax=Celeribacter litoreus TaxID=2876714 RepID=UPI001CCBD6DF|nr:xanthine dehydrogenase family protein subunit M [Celeribacter litoreus]MCA0043391.1 xanthine dehydrogenase family protein subunit M [Celeribacter litoreus]
MYTYEFSYHKPKSVEEALTLFGEFDAPSFLSGGHTLIPTMKNRLAMPDALIDLRSIPDLQGIRRNGDRIEIGAATTHYETSTSDIVREAIPALAALAGSIADPQVRHVGTMGGSVANNDPSADYPSAVLSLGADVVTNQRVIPADEYFDGLFTTALEEGEIIQHFSFPIPESAGYAKLCSQASRYPVAGSFVSKFGDTVRVGVTGAGSDGVFRWTEAEEALSADFSAGALAGLLPDAEEMITDLNGSGEYRANLVAVVTRTAVEHQGTANVR